MVRSDAERKSDAGSTWQWGIGDDRWNFVLSSADMGFESDDCFGIFRWNRGHRSAIVEEKRKQICETSGH